MSIAANFSYNLFYQATAVLVSLVSIPLATRLLGPTGMGIAAFTAGIAQYFATVAMLGIPTYAIREVAYRRGDSRELSHVFSEIITLQVGIGLVVLVAYVLYVVRWGGAYRVAFLLQGLAIIGGMLDVSWFHIGRENFRRNALTIGCARLLLLVGIVVFLRRFPDVHVYIAITTGVFVIGYLFLWRGIFRVVRYRPPRFRDVVRHIGGCVTLFLIVLIGNFALSTFKTILGVRVSIESVAAFDMAYRVTFFLLTFSVVIGTVLIPRIAHAVACNDHAAVVRYLQKSFQIVTGITLPVSAGLHAVAPVFVRWFFGERFEAVIPLLQILSVTIVLNAWSNVIATQYMVPAGKEKMYVRSLLFGNSAAVILALPASIRAGALGVCWARVIGELLVLIVHFLQVRSFLPVRSIAGDSWKYVVAAAPMYAAVQWVMHRSGWNGFGGLLVYAAVGVAVYGVFVFFLQPRVLRDVLSRLRGCWSAVS